MKKILSFALALTLVLGLCSSALAAGAEAMPTNDKLTVDGVVQNPTVYKIGGSNYFKIRDLAAILNGTSKQFAVGYDAAAKSVTATTGQGYTKLDTDLAGPPAGGNKTAILSSDVIYVNGVRTQAEVYKIDGSNYFKLRDLGAALGFAVYWNAEQGMLINTEETPAPVATTKPDGAIGGHYDTAVYYVPADANKDGWITEAEVMAVFEQLEKEYPDGAPWDGSTRYPGLYEYTGSKYSDGMGAASACQGFANLVSDRIFGNLPKYEVSVDEIRPGDYFRSYTSNHSWICYTPYVINDFSGATYYDRYWSLDGNWGGVVGWRTVKFDTDWTNSLGVGASDKIWSRYPKE